MSKINWGRVIIGGAIASVVLVVLSSISMAIFNGQARFKAMIDGLRPSISGAAPLFFVFVFLVLGTLMTLAYVAIQPRFGSGAKTAAIAGFAMWALGVWLAIVGFVVVGLLLGESYWLPDGPMLPCFYLFVFIASTVAGASVYREQEN
jgi:hypothetical protein